MTPGATYTASYHTNVGHYSNTANYFTADVTSGPLTAPAGGNGVYAYGSTSLFPTSTFQATNFWVDVMFNPFAPTPRRRLSPTRPMPPRRAALPMARAARPPPATCSPTTPIPTQATPRPSPRSASARRQARLARRSPERMAASCSMPQGPSPTPSTRRMPPCRPCGNRPIR